MKWIHGGDVARLFGEPRTGFTVAEAEPRSAEHRNDKTGREIGRPEPASNPGVDSEGLSGRFAPRAPLHPLPHAFLKTGGQAGGGVGISQQIPQAQVVRTRFARFHDKRRRRSPSPRRG